MDILNIIRQHVPVKADNEKIKQGLQRFKMDMMKSLPFYGDILMRVPAYEDETVETAQTDGRCIRYNPGFFAKLNEGQRNYVYMHEVLHILLLHWKRQNLRDPLLWNIACDYVVNGTLDKMKWRFNSSKIKFERPFTGCFLDYYDGTSAEELYNKLLKTNENNKGKVILLGKGGSMLPKDLIDILKKSSNSDGENSSENETEERIKEKIIKEMVRDTIKRRGLGDSWFLPQEILKLAESKKLPWHKLLYEFLSEREDEESSYLTPERKYIHMDLIVPGISKTEDELGEIWAFVDTSGSINSAELSQFMTQLYRIAKEFRCIFNIAFWDTKVTDVYKNVRDKRKVLECKPFHSGGTDINCVYKYISENKLKIGVMLVLTDGFFGKVTEKVGNLRKKTILVLSENGKHFEENNEIGKRARL